MAERIAKVETEVSNLKDRNSCEHLEMKKMMQAFIDSADKKYASKITERIAYGLVSIMVIAVVGAILSQVVSAFI